MQTASAIVCTCRFWINSSPESSPSAATPIKTGRLTATTAATVPRRRNDLGSCLPANMVVFPSFGRTSDRSIGFHSRSQYVTGIVDAAVMDTACGGKYPSGDHE